MEVHTNGNGTAVISNDAVKNALINNKTIAGADRSVKGRNKIRRIRRVLEACGYSLLSREVHGERRYYKVPIGSEIDIDRLALELGVAGAEEFIAHYRREQLIRKIECGNDDDAMVALIEFRRCG
jgi:hypothetical protein